MAEIKKIYFKDIETGICRQFNENEGLLIFKFKTAKKLEIIGNKMVETTNRYEEIKETEFKKWLTERNK